MNELSTTTVPYRHSDNTGTFTYVAGCPATYVLINTTRVEFNRGDLIVVRQEEDQPWVFKWFHCFDNVMDRAIDSDGHAWKHYLHCRDVKDFRPGLMIDWTTRSNNDASLNDAIEYFQARFRDTSNSTRDILNNLSQLPLIEVTQLLEDCYETLAPPVLCEIPYLTISKTGGKWDWDTYAICDKDAVPVQEAIDKIIEYLKTCKSESHPHAESIRLYAEDASETNKPWERWEFTGPCASTWMPCLKHPTWDIETNYRRRSSLTEHHNNLKCKEEETTMSELTLTDEQRTIYSIYLKYITQERAEKLLAKIPGMVRVAFIRQSAEIDDVDVWKADASIFSQRNVLSEEDAAFVIQTRISEPPELYSGIGWQLDNTVITNKEPNKLLKRIGVDVENRWHKYSRDLRDLEQIDDEYLKDNAIHDLHIKTKEAYEILQMIKGVITTA